MLGRGYKQGRGGYGRNNNVRGKIGINGVDQATPAPISFQQRKHLADHMHSLGSAKLAANYATTSQFLINHMKKTFNLGNDIA
jgi:hypothetical protein